jgi:hypothetical protein
LIRETPPKSTPARQWPGPLRDPVVRSIAVYGLLAIAMAVAAYYYIFTAFAPYDDEGTLLVTLQSFAHGDVLYRDIYSPYGPFYYELFGGLFALTGKSVTTDASRSIVIVLWVATSLLYGVSAQRLTGRLALGVAAAAAAFSTLFVLAHEPMHPQVLCVLLLGGMTLLAVSGPGRNPARAGALVGALAAGLLLTKLNLGVYAVAAAVLAAALTVQPLRARRWLSWPIVALAIAMPIAVVARDLDQEWARNMVAVEALALAAIAAVGFGRQAVGRDEGLVRWLLGASVGLLAGFVAVMVAILLTGPSLSDIYDGMITEALRVREVNPSPFKVANAAVDWALVSLGAALFCARAGRAEPGAPSWWSGALRIAAGLVILFQVAGVAPLSLHPSAENQLSLPMVLAWVAALAPAGAEESQFKGFLRIFLPALAVAEGLQVYPVAGSQIWIAAVTFVPVAALCLADGIDVLRSWSGGRGSRELQRFAAATAIFAVVLAAILTVDVIGRSVANTAKAYSDEPSLGLPGAADLHLPEDQVQAYRSMVADLHRYGCTDFIGYPNINSLYLWSEIEPPPPDAPGVWLEALDSERQQRIVDELRASKKPCAIRSESRAALWLSGREVPQRPLVRYIFGNFKPVQTVGEFEFMLPKPSATG